MNSGRRSIDMTLLMEMGSFACSYERNERALVMKGNVILSAVNSVTKIVPN